MDDCARTRADPPAGLQTSLGHEQGVLQKVVSTADTAPSAGGRRPWLVSITAPSSFTVTVPEDRLLPARDPFAREAHVAAGGFLEIAACAASTAGLQADTLLFPDGWYGPRELKEVPLARVILEPRREPYPDPLSPWIQYRRTCRGVYPRRPILPELLVSLADACSEVRSVLVYTTRESYVASIGEILEEAAVAACQDPPLRRELKACFAGGIESGGYGGIRGFAHRTAFRLSLLRSGEDATFSSRYLALTRAEAGSAAAIGWIGAPDSRPDQVRAGRAFARVALAAASNGLLLHPMTLALSDSPVMATLQDELHSCLGIPETHRAHILFRIGSGRNIPDIPPATGLPVRAGEG